jgi:hypothetical protein
MTFYPISGGRGGDGDSTKVTIAGKAGSSVTVAVTQEPCGRPDNIIHADLIYPPIGTKRVSRTVAALYFAVYAETAPSTQFPANLHLILGKHETLEGTTLTKAAPPPGSVIPTPVPGTFVTTYMKGSIPPLPAKTTIQTQVYDDTCQPPILAGAFSTQ